jgi:AraC family transcriptional regulator
VAPSANIGAHRHEHAYLALVARGSVIDETSGNIVTVNPGDALFHPAGCVHRNIAGPEGSDGIVIELDAATTVEVCPLYENQPRSILLRASRLDGLALRIASEMRSCDEARDIVIRGLLWQLIALGARRTRGERPGAARWLPEALRYIDGHLGDSLSLAEIASAVGVRPLTLSRHFRGGVGVSLRAYVRNRRVDAAAALLRMTDMAIADIAEACGFADQTQFSRAFRAVLGVTATEYRRMNR